VPGCSDTRGVNVRLGCVCLGGVRLPTMGPGGRVGWRRTPSHPCQTLGGDICNNCNTACGHGGVRCSCSLQRAHQRLCLRFQTEFTAVKSHATFNSLTSGYRHTVYIQSWTISGLPRIWLLEYTRRHRFGRQEVGLNLHTFSKSLWYGEL